jgi:preprotein translocase subunit SecE
MEAKKTVPIEAKVKRWSPFEFIGSVKEEFWKVTWTSGDELRYYTKLVVGATFLFGLGLYFVDLVIRGCLQLLGSCFHYIFG